MSIPVSILMCTRNRAEHLYDTLRSVGELVVPEHLAPELVVVDNGSTDSTTEVLSDPPVENMQFRSVTEPRKGVSRARNMALRVANGRILLWLDDDVRAPPDWLHSMTSPILEKEADAVAGRVVLAQHLRKSWMEPFHRAALAATESMGERELKSIISANMAFSRSVLDKVPGFDPQLGPGSRVGALEDVLFSWQLKEAGYRIMKNLDAVVEHHLDETRLTRAEFIRAARARGRSLSYIRYHWLHHTVEDWTHRCRDYEVWRQPHLVLAKRLVDRVVQRGAHWLKQRNAPISKREFWTIMNLYSLKQYLRERTRPRNYAERGLNKIHGGQLTESQS